MIIDKTIPQNPEFSQKTGYVSYVSRESLDPWTRVIVEDPPPLASPGLPKEDASVFKFKPTPMWSLPL